MVERNIRPITSDGKVTIPKEMRKKHNITDYVEIEDTKEGVLIKAH